MCLFNFEEPIYYEQVNGELKMEQKKITIDLIRQMIMDAMEDMELIQPYPLMAEPKVGLDRSEEVMEGSVKSYKGNRETVDHAVEALKQNMQKHRRGRTSFEMGLEYVVNANTSSESPPDAKITPRHFLEM